MIDQSICLMAAALLLAGCRSENGKGRDAAGANGVSADAAAAADVPDACTFFSRNELEAAVGWELRYGVPKDVSAGSSCGFETQPAAYAKRSYPNPALPESVGFSAITITTHPSQADTFAQGHETPGSEAVPGLGNDAYFNGPNLLHVRVGNRGFSVRIYTDARAPPDVARVRSMMLALARTGASRL